MLTKEQITEKLKNGWIQAAMMFEVLAITEEAAKDALVSHVGKMEKDGLVSIVKKDFLQIEKVEKPVQGIETGFSQVCNIEFLAKNFDTLVQIVLEFGPASIEILKPDKYQLSAGEAHNILNTMAEMMHKFAAAGFGGIVIARGGNEGVVN
ncbi:MAG: hypothetical protein WA139_02745 [Candidatus Aenigmatarchaeota archaeon]